MAFQTNASFAVRRRRTTAGVLFRSQAFPLMPGPPHPTVIPAAARAAAAYPAAAGSAAAAASTAAPYRGAAAAVFPVAAIRTLATAAPRLGAAADGVRCRAPPVMAVATTTPAPVAAAPRGASTVVDAGTGQQFNFFHVPTCRRSCIFMKTCESSAGDAAAAHQRNRAAAGSGPTTRVARAYPAAASARTDTSSFSSRLRAASPKTASAVARAPTSDSAVDCHEAATDACAAWRASTIVISSARPLSEGETVADTARTGATAAFSSAAGAVEQMAATAVPAAAAAVAAAEDGASSFFAATDAAGYACAAAGDSAGTAAAAVGGPLRRSQQRLFYYRFHKHLGKGNFNRYIEFYRKPRGIENTLRLRFNYLPTFSEKKRALMWNVHLMKKLAQATDSKQVLDVWCYYRHKKYKRPYHYITALRRLVEVGGCDPTDYRFRVLANGVLRSAKRFINLPRVCLQLAQLNARGDLQQLSRFLPPRIPLYFPHQLCMLLQAFGLVKLQDKQLFAAAEEALRPHLAYLSAANLLKVACAFAGVLIHNYAVLAQISMQLQLRAGAADWLPAALASATATAAAARQTSSSHSDAVATLTKSGVVLEAEDIIEEDAGADSKKSSDAHSGSSATILKRKTTRRRCMITLQKDHMQQQRATDAAWEMQQEQRHQGNYSPSFSQLVAFGSACATLKYREFGFLELLSLRMQEALRRELEAPLEVRGFQYFSPYAVKEAVEMLQRLKVNDIPLLFTILQHVDARLCDYPPSCLASIGLCSAQLLPCGHPFVRRVHGRMLEALEEALSVLDWSAVQQVAAFAKKMKHRKKVGGEDASPRLRIYEEVERRVLALQGDMHTVFDVARLMELLSSNGRVVSEEALNILCAQSHRHLELFEPVDFCRMARALASIAATLSQRTHSGDMEECTDGRSSSKILTRPLSLTGTSSVKQHTVDLVNALARRALRLHDEFSLRDFSSLLRHLHAAGPPHQYYALPLLQRLREKERLYQEETSRKQQERASLPEVDTLATDVEISAEQLPTSSRKATALRRGRLLLGKEAARRQGRNQLLEEKPHVLPDSSGSDPSTSEGQKQVCPTLEKVEATVKAAARGRRRRLQARLHIAEEEGWNLLHRRVASLRELRGWL